MPMAPRCSTATAGPRTPHDLWSLPRRHGRLRHHDRSHQRPRQRLPGSRPQPWPGSASVTTVDQAGVLGTDLSGLDYEGTGTSTRACSGRSTTAPARCSDCCGMAPFGCATPPTAGRRARRCTSPTAPACPTAEGVTLTDARLGGRGLRVLRARRDRPARPAASRCSATTSRARREPDRHAGVEPDRGPACRRGRTRARSRSRGSPTPTWSAPASSTQDTGQRLQPGDLPEPRHRTVLRRPRGQRDRLRLRPRPDLEQLHRVADVRQRLPDLRGDALGR